MPPDFTTDCLPCISLETTPALAEGSRVWLDQFPANKRSGVANWFHHAVREGALTPHAVLTAVRVLLHRRLQWRPDAHYSAVLATLQHDQAGALAYAQYVLAYEALPSAERQRVKASRALAYLKTTMRGKPVTDAQRWKLGSLGYRGEPPVDRAAASALIDHLLQQERG